MTHDELDTAAEIRVRLQQPVTDATLFEEARLRDAALRAVLDLCDDWETEYRYHEPTWSVLGDVRAAIAEVLLPSPPT